MGRKGGKNLSVSPWFLHAVFLATQKITLCQYSWCKDECISCHLGCFSFEVPLIELVRNANFAKHLDLDAQMRFEMKWWRWWMMFFVLCSVTSNLNVGWQFFVPNDEQIRKGANCCSWLRGGALNHWSLDCLRRWCQCRFCWWWKINDFSVKDHCFLWHFVVWEETKMNTDFLHHIQSNISLHWGNKNRRWYVDTMQKKEHKRQFSDRVFSPISP